MLNKYNDTELIMRNFDKLVLINNEIQKLYSCATILSCDTQVNMPRNASDYRSEVMEMLSIKMAKEKQHKKYKDLIELVKNDSTISTDERIIVESIDESVKFSNRIPVKLHGKLQKMITKCNTEWEQVKLDGKDDTKYLEMLTEYVDAIKESISYANQGEFKTPYDYLLYGYSKGMDASQIESIFASVKPFVDNALAQLTASTDPDFVAPDHVVMEIGQEISELIIGEKDSFTLSKSTHPFTETLGRSDVRITTRIKPHNVLDSIGSVVHESGHATYELGLPRNHYGNALGSAASIAAHEGISLFYEKHVGESVQMASQLASRFGFKYDDVIGWMRSVNPENLVRTESDEITYQRHIINRFTIEKELFNGNLKVSEIPARWNELYGKQLEPRFGYAVDVHWSNGLFGYFPSYTIGHLIAAQLKAKINNMFTDDSVNYDEIRNWLKDHYFKHGAKYGTGDLVKVATGEELNPEYWKKYITQKFNLT